jgi:hypothetical protein
MCYHMMLNLYKLSGQLVRRMDEIRLRLNDGNWWMFYESLVPTTARYFNMTIVGWPQLSKKFSHKTMRYRPCFTTNLDQPGIYHPVKFSSDGLPTQCDVVGK